MGAQPRRENIALLIATLLLCANTSLAQSDRPSSQASQGAGNRLISFEEAGLHGYADAAGRVVIKPQFYLGWDFSEGLARVTTCTDYGYRDGFIDTSGGVAVRPRFDNTEDFSEGLAAVEVNGRWGFVDRRDMVVIRPRFEADDLHHYKFSEGLAAVKVRGKWGYVDRRGRTVIGPQFFGAGNFSGGLAWVNQGFDHINRQGEFVFRENPGRRGDDSASSACEPKTKPPPPTPAELARRREEIYKLILAGRYQHDGAGELLYIGDMTSIPALLRVLKDNAPKGCVGERCGYICTYAHALAALEKITGHKAVAYDDWAAWWDEYQKSHPRK